jgi:hypothetical protein
MTVPADCDGSGIGGTYTGSFNGGISARSEKLVPAELGAGADIIGSPPTLGDCSCVSGSSTAADITGLKFDAD